MQRKKFARIFACILFATIQEAMEENNLEKLAILADAAATIQNNISSSAIEYYKNRYHKKPKICMQLFGM